VIDYEKKRFLRNVGIRYLCYFFGFALSISNGLITFLVNIFYFAVYLSVIVFSKKIKKLNGLSVQLGVLVSILTFGGKGLADFFSYWNTKISFDK